jgi:hypothetical protein
MTDFSSFSVSGTQMHRVDLHLGGTTNSAVQRSKQNGSLSTDYTYNPELTAWLEELLYY